MGQLHSTCTAPHRDAHRLHHAVVAQPQQQLRRAVRSLRHVVHDGPPHRGVAAQNGLHTERFTHRMVYTTQNGLYTERFTHTEFNSCNSPHRHVRVNQLLPHRFRQRRQIVDGFGRGGAVEVVAQLLAAV
jgi:hypothetical protein